MVICANTSYFGTTVYLLCGLKYIFYRKYSISCTDKFWLSVIVYWIGVFVRWYSSTYWQILEYQLTSIGKDTGSITIPARLWLKPLQVFRRNAAELFFEALPEVKQIVDAYLEGYF